MTRAARQVTLWMIAVFSLDGCARSEAPADPARIAFDSTAAVASLREADLALEAAVEAKDAARTAGYYAEDATLLPVAEPIVEGRAAIEREWAKVFGIPGFKNVARISQIEVARGGSLAFARGTYETQMVGVDGKPTVERGKWVTVWRHDATAGWRVVADIFNTDAPPPTHQESVTRDGPPSARR